MNSYCQTNSGVTIAPELSLWTFFEVHWSVVILHISSKYLFSSEREHGYCTPCCSYDEVYLTLYSNTHWLIKPEHRLRTLLNMPRMWTSTLCRLHQQSFYTFVWCMCTLSNPFFPYLETLVWHRISGRYYRLWCGVIVWWTWWTEIFVVNSGLLSYMYLCLTKEEGAIVISCG